MTAFDEQNLILYVSLFQIFRIWFVPFYHAPVHLTAVLTLRYNCAEKKYYIHSQNDLYQVDQFVKFFAPGGWALVYMWHAFACAFCVLGAWALWPVTWVEEYVGWGSGDDEALRRQKGLRVKEWKWLDGRSGSEAVAESDNKGRIAG